MEKTLRFKESTEKEVKSFIKSATRHNETEYYFVMEDQYTDNPTLYKVESLAVPESYSFMVYKGLDYRDCHWKNENIIRDLDGIVESIMEIIERDY